MKNLKPMKNKNTIKSNVVDDQKQFFRKESKKELKQARKIARNQKRNLWLEETVA